MKPKAKTIDGPFKMGNIKWNYFFQQNNSHCIYLNNSEEYALEFSTYSTIKIAKVFLHTNSIKNTWEYIEIDNVDHNQFSKKITFKNCGLFHFRLLYQVANDKCYYWDHESYTRLTIEPQDCNNLSLYTYIPNVSGKIPDWINDFNKIKELGFNAIHLLPITALDKSQSPYSAKDLFSIDPYYYEPVKNKKEKYFLDALINSCQKNSLKLCIDLVFNHIGIESNVSISNPHWLQADPSEPNGLKRAGCWHNNQWIKWTDLALIDFEHPNENIKNEIWDYMISYALYWADIASQTGGIIRLDNLHSTNFLFIEKALSEIKREFPDLIIQAELFADDYAINKYLSKGNINLMLATPWLNPFASDFRNQIKNLHHIYNERRYIFAVNSHDSDSATEMYGAPEAIIPRYAATALMSTGCTSMVQGAEHGITKKLVFIGYQNRMEVKEIPEIRNALKIINQTKNKFKTFQTGQNIEFIDNENSAILACIRFGEKFYEPDFLIITNFNSQGSQHLSLNLTNYHDKNGKNIFNNEIIPLYSLKDTNLHPFQTLILEIQN